MENESWDSMVMCTLTASKSTGAKLQNQFVNGSWDVRCEKENPLAKSKVARNVLKNYSNIFTFRCMLCMLYF